MNIYVGNLAREVSEKDLENTFSSFGSIRSVKVIRDLFSGESKGFAFVEMAGTKEGQAAINELTTKELKGKKLIVNEARPKTNTRDRNSRSNNNSNSNSNSGPRRNRF